MLAKRLNPHYVSYAVVGAGETQQNNTKATPKQATPLTTTAISTIRKQRIVTVESEIQ